MQRSELSYLKSNQSFSDNDPYTSSADYHLVTKRDQIID